MDNKNNISVGMKGVYGGSTATPGRHDHKRSVATRASRVSKGRLPAYWGIDLVMIALMLWLTVLVVMNWDSILFTTAQIVSQILVGATILLVLALVIAVVLGIRNKRVW